MSENKQRTVAEMLAKNFQRLPEAEQKFFLQGPVFMGVNAAFSGLIANNLYRRALNVTQGAITSSLPMAVLPFVTTFAFYNVVVSNPLLLGDLNCPSCVLLRGALVGVAAGGVYPILLALPLNLGLGVRYNSIVNPEKGTMLRYCLDVSRPILRKMWPMMMFQAAFGTYLSSKNFESYHKLAQLTFGPAKEELVD